MSTHEIRKDMLGRTTLSIKGDVLILSQHMGGEHETVLLTREDMIKIIAHVVV